MWGITSACEVARQEFRRRGCGQPCLSTAHSRSKSLWREEAGMISGSTTLIAHIGYRPGAVQSGPDTASQSGASAEERLSRLHRRQHVGRVDAQTQVVEAKFP